MDVLSTTPLQQNVAAILELVGSSIGIYGATWVMRQYLNGHILNNSPGLFIFSMACLDVLNSCTYLLDAVNILILHIDITFSYFIYSWTVISSCLLGMVLAFNTFNIATLHGNTHRLDSLKWLLIVVIILLPIPLYFVPISLVYHQNIFLDTFTCPIESNGEITMICDIISNLLFIIVAFAVCFNITAYGVIYLSLEKESQRGMFVSSKSQSRRTIQKLVMIYSIAIIFAWLPWLLTWIINYFINVQNPMCRYLVTLGEYLTSSMRGYIHALGVSFAHRTVSNMNSTSFAQQLIRSLRLESSMKQIPSKNSSGMKSSDDKGPNWDFTFSGEILNTMDSSYQRTTLQ